ncbi:hypothetical protein J4Q44_G00328300 [Coregonus suidteri]|uniref:SAM domain-containing protein n=1 Tax=Coregonus suidteri TaxID=861788 RepID=A0AAN8QHD0_9TELE
MYRDLSDRDSEPQGPGSECLGSSMSQDSQDCLGSMTQESQDIYLRMDHHRRRSGYRLGRIIARQQLLRRIAGELEAKEACDWLRAAGFPQYAQLFEDSQFPIDISPVKKDHYFLDKDLVEPLCRRLNTLNKVASMKIDVNLPKKKIL